MTMLASSVSSFRDNAVNLLSKWRSFYYRVRLIEAANISNYVDYGSTPYKQVVAGEPPGGVSLGAPPDIIALEAIRRFNLVLREYGGRRVLVLSERTWGSRCPDCWDSLKRRRKKSNCMTCFDTSITGGYFAPIEAWSMMPPHRVMTQLTPLFELQIDDRVMWFSRYPELKPRDVVITVDGDRFRVIAITRSEKAQSLTRQTVQLRRLSRDQVEYKIPVDNSWSRDSQTASGTREHIRAMNLEAFYQTADNKNLDSGVQADGELAHTLESSTRDAE